MILVEKRVLKEKKSYLNMDIQQKKKFKPKKFYFFKRKYSYYKRFSKKKKLLIFRNKIKKRRLPVSIKRKLIRRSGKRGFLKRYALVLIRQRIESIRVRNYLWRYKWYRKKLVWRRRFKKGFKIFYKKLIKLTKHGGRLGHYRIVAKFYARFGLLPFMSEIIKYSRLRYILKRHGKVFRRKKKKIIIIREVYREKSEKLFFLSIFIQTLISKGKKKLSLNIFLSVFTLLKFKFKNDFISKFFVSLERIRPLINYKTMYIGGKKYKIPVLMPVFKSYCIGTR
jgi:hypothetical protein